MLRRLAAGVGVNIFDKLVVAGTQFALVPLLALHWGLARYGTWIMLSTIPTFLAVGDLGLGTAAGTKMTIANARGERDAAIRIFHSAWLAILISSLVFAVLSVVVAWAMPAWLFGKTSGMDEASVRLTLLLLLFYTIAAVQGSIFFAGFRAAQQFAAGAFWNAIIILVENGMLIVAIVLHAQPPLAAATLLAGRIVGLVGQNVLLRKVVPWLPIGLGEARWAELRTLIAPAGAVMILPIAQSFLLQGTALALAAAAGPAAVPAFTATRTLSRIGLQLCWTMNAAMMPEVSAALGRRDHQTIAMLVFIMVCTSAALSVPFALGFALFGKWAVAQWSGHVILAPVSLIWTMAFGILCVGLWFPLSNLLLAADRQQSYTIIFLFLATIAVGISYLLSRSLGATGAGIALSGTDFIMLIVVVRLTRTHLASVRSILGAGTHALEHARAMMRNWKEKRS